ncbi:MAG: bL21 family ribosomal protein [Elusimicrobiales bacterium]
MYAIIETGGKQYWVVPGEVLQVEKLTGQEGAEVTFKALWSASRRTRTPRPPSCPPLKSPPG